MTVLTLQERLDKKADDELDKLIDQIFTEFKIKLSKLPGKFTYDDRIVFESPTTGRSTKSIPEIIDTLQDKIYDINESKYRSIHTAQFVAKIESLSGQIEDINQQIEDL